MLAVRTPEFGRAVNSIKYCSTDKEMRQMAESYLRRQIDEEVRLEEAINEANAKKDAELAAERKAHSTELADKDAKLAAEREKLAAEKAINDALKIKIAELEAMKNPQ
jgi:hypothetical protein